MGRIDVRARDAKCQRFDAVATTLRLLWTLYLRALHESDRRLRAVIDDKISMGSARVLRRTGHSCASGV